MKVITSKFNIITKCATKHIFSLTESSCILINLQKQNSILYAETLNLYRFTVVLFVCLFFFTVNLHRLGVLKNWTFANDSNKFNCFKLKWIQTLQTCGFCNSIGRKTLYLFYIFWISYVRNRKKCVIFWI